MTITVIAITVALILIGHALAGIVGIEIFNQRYFTILVPLVAALGAAALVALELRWLTIAAAVLLLVLGIGNLIKRWGHQFEPSLVPVRTAVTALHPRTVLTDTPVVVYYLRSLSPQLDRPFNLGAGRAATCARPCVIVDDLATRTGTPRAGVPAPSGGVRQSLRADRRQMTPLGMRSLRSQPVSSLASAPERAAPGDPRATQSPVRAPSAGGQPVADRRRARRGARRRRVRHEGGRRPIPEHVGADRARADRRRGRDHGAVGRRTRPRRYGLVALLLFAALARVTTLSIAWSVTPEHPGSRPTGRCPTSRCSAPAWRSRGCSAALAGAGRRDRVVATALSAYALLVKVFPATFAPTDSLGRLSAPFGYWNATGLIAALGLPACLWVGARRDAAPALRGLVPPAIAVLVSVVVLSYSRSAVLASIAGLALWFAVVPMRLRGAFVLGLGLLGAAAISGWALATHALTQDHVALASRTSAGHGFGIVIVLVLFALGIVSLVGAFAVDRTVLAPEARRRIGLVLIGLVALVPVAGVASLAASQRGFTGEISHVWSTLTTTKESVGDNPGRLIELGSSRARDWNDGWARVHALGARTARGAVGYATARLRYSTSIFRVDHAHSYIAQTLADFGLIGHRRQPRAAHRLVARHPDDGPRPGARPAAITRAVGTADAAVRRRRVRRPLGDRLDLVHPRHRAPGPPVRRLAGRTGTARGARRAPGRARATVDAAAIGLVCTGLITITLLAAWAIWQPLHSDDATGAVLTALTRGDTAAAFTDARDAAARDPLSVQPLWLLAELYSRIGMSTPRTPSS